MARRRSVGGTVALEIVPSLRQQQLVKNGAPAYPLYIQHCAPCPRPPGGLKCDVLRIATRHAIEEVAVGAAHVTNTPQTDVSGPRRPGFPPLGGGSPPRPLTRQHGSQN